MNTVSVIPQKAAPAPANKRKKSALKRSETLAGFLFVSPMLIGVTVLVLIPILATFALSFADWNFIMGLRGFKWAGAANFVKLLDDDVFKRSIINNMLFLLVVPVYMLVSLILAVIIDHFVYWKSFFKVAYFMPYISNIVAVAVVWQVLFQPSYGPINSFLQAIGIKHPPGWIADPNFALVSLMMITVWISIGFNMVVYIAGLQSIPKDLYEAADIDGASTWTKFTRITVPLLSPTSFFLLVTGIIYSFKAFDLVAVLTQGGPINSTTLMVWDLYYTAFRDLKIGYASSMGVVLFLFVFAITGIQWIVQKKWVDY
ncbi:MAG TPA: sugar ABC transporter permease [Bacilli bacterium]